ncbi:hypothetical protein [Campylobacter iguaniorum]|uniref:hypothetical protein n=1 Tax=Campylobacter iguaniorum TaxID=1244531 RepID=UPI0011A31327|nr:hypothetical protein [Campylobacter iguaniorum]
MYNTHKQIKILRTILHKFPVFLISLKRDEARKEALRPTAKMIEAATIEMLKNAKLFLFSIVFFLNLAHFSTEFIILTYADWIGAFVAVWLGGNAV